MKQIVILRFLLLLLACGLTTLAAEDAADAYLIYRFGGTPTIDARFIHPHPDAWMLAGPRNAGALKEISDEPLGFTQNGSYITTIANRIILVEIRDGKVDPTANLEALYAKHKQLIARLFYFALMQDKAEIEKLVTDVRNISFGGAPAANRGDMDQYAVVLGEIPAYRISDPISDNNARSITYRVPVGTGLFLKLIQVSGQWKVDTHAKLDLPLKMFFQ